MDKTIPTADEILRLVPQQSPFRFIDEITFLSETKIQGTYRFKETEFFYKGHFPGSPITPGVILLECMCQIGVVAHGLYLVALEQSGTDWKEEIKKWTTLFSDAEVEFYKPVLPNTKVYVDTELEFWKRKKIRSKVKMTLEDGTLVATATAAGIGVKL